MELTTLEQHMSSTKVGYANALSLGTNSCKKSNVATLNSPHQAKKQCNIDSGWLEQHEAKMQCNFDSGRLERQQCSLHSFL